MAKVYCGVYRIQSRVHPDRCYIGSAINIHKRWDRHKKNFRDGTANAIIQAHYNKYGIEDFEFSIVALCSKQELFSQETIWWGKIVWIEQCFILAYKYNGSNRPYLNASPFAGNVLGVKHSEQANKAKSIRQTGKPRPPFSEETLAIITAERRSRKYKPLPQWYKKGQESTFKGKTHTEEAKEKNRQKHIGSHDVVMKGVETRRKNGKIPKRDSKGHFMKKDW